MDNDFELLYLIQCHYDRGAKDILFNKYKPLIYKIVLNYIYDKNLIKDYIQISFLKLEKAYNSFYPDSNKTFTRYFELILKRDIFKLIKKTYKDIKSVVVEENIIDIYNNNYSYDTQLMEFNEDKKEYVFDKNINFNSELLGKIYNTIYINNKTIKEATLILNLDKKKIYNALYRIKNILKDKINN